MRTRTPHLYERLTYEQILGVQLQEIRDAAAAARTYGEWWDVEADIKELLEDLKKSIRKHRYEFKKYGAKAARFLERFGSTDTLYTEWSARAERRMRLEILIREELKAGLREMKRQDREERALMEKICREIEERRQAEAA